MPAVVLIKSESDGPDKFATVLEENNFHVFSIFCINFQFKNLEVLRDKLAKTDDYEGIVFTSPRAVHGVHKATEGKLSGWSDKRNFCVGEATSELVESLLGLKAEGEQSGNAQKLAEIMISSHTKEPFLKLFLFPSGNLKQDVLENSLEESAIKVESIEVYETVQHAELDESIHKLKTEKIDFIVFFSPSGVKFSLPLLRNHQINLDNIKIIAIGPSTKKSLDENELQCHRMCSKPTPESLIEALTS